MCSPDVPIESLVKSCELKGLWTLLPSSLGGRQGEIQLIGWNIKQTESELHTLCRMTSTERMHFVFTSFHCPAPSCFVLLHICNMHHFIQTVNFRKWFAEILIAFCCYTGRWLKAWTNSWDPSSLQLIIRLAIKLMDTQYHCSTILFITSLSLQVQRIHLDFLKQKKHQLARLHLCFPISYFVSLHVWFCCN